MSVITRIVDALTSDGDGTRVDFTDVACRDCGNEFRTVKDLDRVECPDCLSAEVAPADD